MGANESLQLTRHLVTVDEYYLMAEVGVLAPDARVELIEGEIIDMAPQKSRHASAVGKLMRRLVKAAGEQALVACQVPLRLSPQSEPEPDLMLLRPRKDEYAESHPTSSDVFLLIEVADSSARYDREIKVPLYARHGVAEVWVIDLDAGRVRFYRQPQGDEYADISSTEAPGITSLPGLPGSSFDLSGVLR